MDKGKLLIFVIIAVTVVILVGGILYIVGRVALRSSTIFSADVPVRKQFQEFNNSELDFTVFKAEKSINYHF